MAINYNTTLVTTTPYIALSTDEVILVNVAGPASVILPAIVAGKNTAFYVKDASGNALTNPITITAAGGATINGIGFALINGNYSHVQFVWDGTGWLTLTN
jgi:hypothetical protein